MFTSSISLEGLAALIKGKDPVCGKDVDPAQAVGVFTHNSNTYYFCSVECKEAFVAEPAKYALTAAS
jgi:YHS domain-containing protein